MIKNTDRYSDFLILRDYLLNNEEEAKRYSDFKIKLVNSRINDRKEYNRIKSEYVTELLEIAKNHS